MKLEVNHKKIWKDHKYMKVEKHATKQQIGQPGNQRRHFKNTWKQMKMKTQWSKTFGMQQKES